MPSQVNLFLKWRGITWNSSSFLCRQRKLLEEVNRERKYKSIQTEELIATIFRKAMAELRWQHRTVRNPNS